MVLEMSRCTFSFGQLEELLVVMHRIAPDKRIAFQGRLKHLQRWGFPTGKKPGKGRAIKYTADDLFRAVLALELIQAGLNPKLAVDIVNFNWGGIRSTVYLNCYSQSERQELHPDDADDFCDYSWIVRPEALLPLTVQGEGEYDHCDAITPVRDDELVKALDIDAIGFSPVLGAHWRNIVIRGGPLVRGVLFLIEHRFGWASTEDIRKDLGDAAANYGKHLRELIETIDVPKAQSGVSRRRPVSERYGREEIVAAMKILEGLSQEERLAFSMIDEPSLAVNKTTFHALLASGLLTVEAAGVELTRTGEIAAELLTQHMAEAADVINTQAKLD